MSAVVAAIDEAARTARVDITAEVDGTKVLGRARATLALPAVDSSETRTGNDAA